MIYYLHFLLCKLRHRRNITCLSLALCLLLLTKAKLSIRTRNYLTKQSLLPHDKVDWHVLLSNGDERSFIQATSLTRDGFNELLYEFSKYFQYKSGPGKKGRPATVFKKSTALGIILTFYRDTVSLTSICRMFGIVPAVASALLEKAETALLKALKNSKKGRISWPSMEQQRFWGTLVERKCPDIKGRWGFIDGKNYRVQKPSNSDIQNAMYNGWLHATLITGVFCFGVDGTIVWGKHNFVGSWNDGETSRDFCIKLSDDGINVPGHGVLSDSAFPCSKQMQGRIMSPLKEGELEKNPAEFHALLQRISSSITSMRQSAEWGMGSVEKPYRRLLEKLPFNPLVRSRRIETINRLYNFRVRSTGISQIRSYFAEEIDLN